MKASHDQRRSLLQDEDGVEVGDNGERRVRGAARSKLHWTAVLVLALTITALLGILGDWSSFVAPYHQPEQGDHNPSTTDAEAKQDSPLNLKPQSNTNDYVLGASWDFDAAPQRREHSWTVRERELNPDGVFRPMILVNDQFPGPLIEANEGDTIVVHVSNQATNATAVHWHGLYQNGTNHMDGTVGVTQCPIPPGANFTYEFTVAGQHGTYWWHSHVSAQASDGMYGPLVIHSKRERDLQRLDYASEQVIMVADHYYDLSSSLLMEYLASDRENIEPVPDTALINGKGVRDCDTVPRRRCDNTTENVGWFSMAVRADQMHRLRLINTGAFAEIQVSLDENEFAVTEVDGVDVAPERFHRLVVHPGQRYSVIVGPAKATQSVWLRVKMMSTCFDEENVETQLETRAVVNFVDQKSSIDATSTVASTDWDDQTSQICRDMNTSALIPTEVISAPSKADVSFYVRSNFKIGAYRLSRGFFNGSSFRPDLLSPTLMRALDGLGMDNSNFVIGGSAQVNSKAFAEEHELVLQTAGIQVIDLTIVNFDDGAHPFHLHGYKYFVLAQGHGYPPQNVTDTLNLSNPLRRDTATVEGFGWMLVRIVADNPGVWAFHCHVTWHSEAGLMMQLLTRADDLIKSVVIPRSSQELCAAPIEQLRKGATPEDEVFMNES
ncbi:MAG: hypothetical protein Q9159_007687 [Coniocarpon cinnabarinum]